MNRFVGARIWKSVKAEIVTILDASRPRIARMVRPALTRPSLKTVARLVLRNERYEGLHRRVAQAFRGVMNDGRDFFIGCRAAPSGEPGP